MLCGYLTILMFSGVFSAVDCGSWVAAVCALLVCWGCGDVVLIFVPAQGGCDRMSLAG